MTKNTKLTNPYNFIFNYASKTSPTIEELAVFLNKLNQYENIADVKRILSSASVNIINHMGYDNRVILFDIYFNQNNRFGIDSNHMYLNIIMEQMNSALRLKENVDFFTNHPHINQIKLEHLFFKLAEIKTMSSEITTFSQKERMQAYEKLMPIYEKWVDEDLNKRDYFTDSFLKHLLFDNLAKRKMNHENAIEQIRQSLEPFSKSFIEAEPDLIFQSKKMNLINLLLSLGFDQVVKKEKEKTQEVILSFLLANQHKQAQVFLCFHSIEPKDIQTISNRLYTKNEENKNGYIASDSIYHEDNIQKLVSFLEKQYLDSLQKNHNFLTKIDVDDELSHSIKTEQGKKKLKI